jgi:hypothetical protein
MKTQSTHESVLGAHGDVVGLRRRNDVKVADGGGDDNTKHKVGKVLSAAEAAASSKRHQVLVH